MKTKLSLPRGTTGFYDDKNQWVCTGSQMGRPNWLPASFPAGDYPEGNNTTLKLRLTRLPFVDQCYDRWGAYWGAPATIWCGWVDGIRVFVRATSRAQAKLLVLNSLPNARFYR